MASACLQFDERPETPREIRKYRKSFHAKPGSRVCHPGAIDDNARLLVKLGGQRLGGIPRKDTGGHVPECFAQEDRDPVALFLKTKAESKYRRNIREPLGKPYVRGHKFAERNVAPAKDEFNSKELLYPGEECKLSTEEESKAHGLYLKSHKSYLPGEQKRRNYDWKGLNKDETRFGVTKGEVRSSSVAECLNGGNGGIKSTVIGNAKVADFQRATHKKLGRATSLGLNRKCNAERKKMVNKEWNVKQVVEGNYSLTEQMPDADLGRAIKPGTRNETTSGRVFGAPTVRTDVKPPKNRSVADNNNYGDDTNACRLIYPSRFSSEGLYDADFVVPRSENELRSVVVGAGYDESNFAAMYEKACQMTISPKGQASVEELRSVMLNW